MGFMGIGTLIKIIDENFEELSNKILAKLCKSEVIIKEVLVPYLKHDLLASSSSKERNAALNIMIQLKQLAYSQNIV
jgi:hypothetical protein